MISWRIKELTSNLEKLQRVFEYYVNFEIANGVTNQDYWLFIMAKSWAQCQVSYVKIR